MNEDLKPLTEHLSELRTRIIWVVVTFMLALIVGFIYAPDIFNWIRQDSLQHVKLFVFSPVDAFRLYMQLSFLIAWITVVPVMLYHAWKFVTPGLYPHERRAAFVYIPVSLILFLLGILFGYFLVFPYLINFLETINQQMGLTPQYNVYQYFTLMFQIIFPLSLFFEIPVIFVFLTRLRLVTPEFLRKIRRGAYLVMVILGAIISPPDFGSNIMVTLPMIVLYEIGILVSNAVYRRILEEEQEREEDR
ncbi:twin-arginine translocase subunit TatC [Staphylospora marina]|uniref:twin-arginine translocase subunit TatC n=1 Tax=Staphylospora marina TaxID=2490858 RepID=UPI0013DDD9F1|nr:twin-arginine translocase subunit TatC [Staphylospora marina]